ncbi:hypothetical protein BDV36DRAFT_279609 [Aspergillus pseudocaelatus]|uniref:Uncharacterized protein n=1 Tax=Aspergillus pseudocaelatus TaxID=1825620 RepID=A0ABQ6X1Q2_9EURO|nr:hypothetical protein BDV36DRAFT_279609 [Aspergillus pseudocaelatus]
MRQHSPFSYYVSHKPKELRRLYEPLSLLCALREQIPEHKLSEVDDARGMSGISQRRRDFLNALVRLAAFKQEWHLAITAGCDQESVIIAVAGDLDVSNPVVRFLDALLEMVKQALDADLNATTLDAEICNISNYVMKWQRDNSFAVYHRIFDHIAPVCIPIMAAWSNDPEVLDDIAHRMSSGIDNHKELSQRLMQVVPAPSKLIPRLQYYQENIYTLIHPELRVMDFFDKNSRLQYWDNYDKYIATSKPCCYLCSQYLSHRRNYHIRNCDPNDIDLQWRLPDIQAAESSARFEEQRKILRKITERARRDVESFILERCSGSNDLTDDDSSQSSSPSIETITTSQELSNSEANECLNPYRLPSGTEDDKYPGSERWDGTGDEEEEDYVVFKGRKVKISSG